MAAPTRGPRTAGAIAREHIAGGADLILAAGGDGTINEVAEGMVHCEVPLGVLPAGTANVLGMEMGLGGDPVRAAERLDECRPRRISVGHVTCDGGRVSRHFLLMAGVGLDAHVVYHVNAALKDRIGRFAYWVAGWSLLGRRLPQFRVEIDGRPRECSFALLSKVRNYGGDFEIAKRVTLLDDEFEAVLFQGRTSLPYVKYFAGMTLEPVVWAEGRGGAAVPPRRAFLPGQRFRIRADRWRIRRTPAGRNRNGAGRAHLAGAAGVWAARTGALVAGRES